MRYILPDPADIANSSSSSSSEDEDIVATAVRVLPKTRSFFTSAEKMDKTAFCCHFRLVVLFYLLFKCHIIVICCCLIITVIITIISIIIFIVLKQFANKLSRIKFIVEKSALKLLKSWLV